MRDYKYGDLYFDTQHDKQMKIDVVGTGIVIDNSMIEMEAFGLDETLCSESELKFGRCEANCVKFTARNLPGSINGKTINVTETIDGNTDEPFPYGKYKVYSDVPTSDRTKREITAYDAMYDIINADVKQWYAGLTFPMTLRQFRDSFFSYLGIIQKETTLVNDGMTVNKTLITESSSDSNMTEVDSISGKTVIEAICEINGVFGNINRDGLFEYVELKPIINPLYPANDLYPRDDLFPRDPNTVSMSGHYITFDYEDFQTKIITQLEIRSSDNTAGEKVGEAGNNYVISGNFLVSDKSGAELNGIAQNVFEVIRKVSYTPIKSSSCVGNPCIELGDPIRFNTTREIVESYALQRTLTGIQAKRDSIESHGVEYYPVNNNGIKKRVEDVENRADSLEQTADEIQEDVEEFKSETTVRFEKTENSIEAEVTRAQGAEGELSSKLSITESEISSEVAARQSADSEMSSMISQTAYQIELKVSKGDVSSQLSLESGQILISGDRLIIDCSNFFLDSNGNAGIKGSLLYDYGDYENYEILSHDGRNRPIVQAYIGHFTELSVSGEIDGSVSNASNASYATTAGVANSIKQGIVIRPNDIYLQDVDTSSGGYNALINKSTGHIYAETESSRRYKNSISDTCNGDLDPHKLYLLKVQQYKYNTDYLKNPQDPLYDKFVIGFIAEDVADAYPIATIYDDYGNADNWNPRYLIPPMLALIQEQHKDIELLKQENLNLQNRLSILEQKMEVLENAYNNQNN